MFFPSPDNGKRTGNSAAYAGVRPREGCRDTGESRQQREHIKMCSAVSPFYSSSKLVLWWPRKNCDVPRVM